MNKFMGNHIVIDGNYIFHKCKSVVMGYDRNATLTDTLATTEQQAVLFRKCITDTAYAINNFEDVKSVVVVFDHGTSWRKLAYPPYKDKGVKDESEVEGWNNFYSVMNKYQRFMESRGFIISFIDGLEGDDMLMFWSERLSLRFPDDKIVVVTGDRDMVQLVSNNVFVYSNNSTQLKFFYEEFSNTPKLVNNEKVEFVKVDNKKFLFNKVLIGDNGDKVPNVLHGVGEKRAEEITEMASSYNSLSCNYVDEEYSRSVALFVNSTFKFQKDEELLFQNIRRNAMLMQLSCDWLSEDHNSKLLEEFNKKVNTFTYTGEYTLTNILKDEQ